jgi:RsiW-degrading membrane proteinase PrsW (M82 family)
VIVSRRLWVLLLAAGAPIWIVAAVITGVTEDTILLPTVGFLGGGTLGLCFAALTEVYILPTTYGTFAGVGIIEEGAKAIVLVAAARGLSTRRPREGMILGATVGAGFAPFESSGYALKAFIDNIDEHSVLNIVGTEAVRAVSAPFGHIMWTAILGGAIFAGRRVLLTFVGVVVLHAQWDASNGWAITLSQGILGDGWTLDWPNTKDWVGFPTGQELEVYNAISAGLLVLLGAIGTWWLLSRWRSYAD